MKKIIGALDDGVLKRFPLKTGIPSFQAWVSNLSSIEQFIATAGVLSPDFYLVGDLVLWSETYAEMVALGQMKSWGRNNGSLERYCNILNLDEFFLQGYTEACEDEQLVTAFGRSIEHFWRQELKSRFPEKTFNFEVGENLVDDEHGICLTFYQ